MQPDGHPMLALVRQRARELLPEESWIVSEPGRSLTAKFRPESISPLLSASGLEADAQFWLKHPFQEVTFEFAGDPARKHERDRLASHFRDRLVTKGGPPGLLTSAGSTICRLRLPPNTGRETVDRFIEFVRRNLSVWCRDELPKLARQTSAQGSKGIPAGITRVHVLQAIQDFASGIAHPFGPSTGYDLIYRDTRYPPKAILGIAAARVKGSSIWPDDFSSGEASFRILRKLGFVVVPKGEGPLFPDEVGDESYVEGSVTRVTVNRYERDSNARKKCISHYGAICQVCDFDFAEKFGAIGTGFIHVHHLVPLSDIRKGYVVDPIKHLRPVCPNCHAMVHRRSPPFEIDEIKQLRAT